MTSSKRTNRGSYIVVIIVFQNVVLDFLSEGEVPKHSDGGVTQRRAGEAGAHNEDPVFDGPLLQRTIHGYATHVTLVRKGDGGNDVEHIRATFGRGLHFHALGGMLD